MISEQTMSAHDGRQIFYRYSPAAGDTAPRALVVILHGYGEHSERYLETIERFSERGFAVCAPDHRGFGKSAQTPGDIEGFIHVAADVHQLTAEQSAAAPDAPVVIVGHSLGGLLALNQLLTHPGDYALAVLSGPAILPPPDASPFLVAVARLIATVAPRLKVQSLDLGATTRNAEMKAFDARDPLAYNDKVRARTAWETLKTQKAIPRRMSEITVPTLLLHGGDDAIIAPRASEIVLDGIGSSDKERIVFPGLWHEVFNEPERDTVFERVFAWLDARLPA